MLINPLKDKLQTLKLTGFLEALHEQETNPALMSDLSFEERLGLLVDREIAAQENRRTERRLKMARLRQNATPEDMDFRAPRNLSRPLFQTLLSGQWIASHQNILITGPTGVGKSYIAKLWGTRPVAWDTTSSSSASPVSSSPQRSPGARGSFTPS